jgi:hypothetical protein
METTSFVQTLYLWATYNYQKNCHFPLNNLYQLFYVMEMKCVFCNVGTKLLNILVDLRFQMINFHGRMLS